MIGKNDRALLGPIFMSDPLQVSEKWYVFGLLLSGFSAENLWTVKGV